MEHPVKPFFQNNNATLYHGDCLDLMPRMSAGSVDMIFADPPYGLSNGGITIKSGKVASVNKGDWDKSRGVDEDFAFHDNWIREAKRLLKPNGTLWVSGTYHSIYACGHALQKNDYKILNDIAWFKPNAPFNASRRYFTASHESLIWAAKSKETKHHFNYDLMREGQWVGDQLKKAGKQMRSVWSIPFASPSEKLHGRHPTQKPLRLLNRIVQASTEPGHVILDPFAGSSTTGVAAVGLDRNFIGIDNEAKYLELSKVRLKEI